MSEEKGEWLCSYLIWWRYGGCFCFCLLKDCHLFFLFACSLTVQIESTVYQIRTCSKVAKNRIQLKQTLIKEIYVLMSCQVQNEGGLAPQWHQHGLRFFLSLCFAFGGAYFFQWLPHYFMVAKWLSRSRLHLWVTEEVREHLFSSILSKYPKIHPVGQLKLQLTLESFPVQGQGSGIYWLT